MESIRDGVRWYSELKWSERLPTRPGWYWWRNLKREKEEENNPVILYVRDFAGHLAVGNCRIAGTSYERGEWVGPIPEPA